MNPSRRPLLPAGDPLTGLAGDAATHTHLGGLLVPFDADPYKTINPFRIITRQFHVCFNRIPRMKPLKALVLCYQSFSSFTGTGGMAGFCMPRLFLYHRVPISPFLHIPPVPSFLSLYPTCPSSPPSPIPPILSYPSKPFFAYGLSRGNKKKQC